MELPHIVYLVGFMGCGKTTAGKKLAASLNWSFIDLDKKIEEETGLTINELFSTHGEDYFREVEARTLRSLQFNSNHVIATGGGTPCFKNNMEYMNSVGCTVYLKLTPSQLAARLKPALDERPLIQNIGKEELLHFIETRLEERSVWYEKSQFTTNGFGVDIPLINRQVLSHFSY